METINFKNKTYDIIEKYHSNKLHVKRDDKQYIIIPFDTYSAYSTYLDNKKLLKKNKVEISKIIKKDKKGLMILEQYIEGTPVIELLAKNSFTDAYATELFRVYRNNRFAKIALDYKPHNFVLKKKYFYYVSDEIYKYNTNTAFEKTDDINLYLSTDNQERYIKSHNYEYAPRNKLKGGELNKQIVLFCVAHW